MDHQSLANIDFLGFSDPVSSISHLLAAFVFLLIGVRVIYRHRVNTAFIASMSIFVLAVIFTLSMSGVYHLLTPETPGREVMQRLDHAAIFFLIAATFTPVHVLLFKGFLRWGILLLIWSTAITGITLKSIFFNDINEWLGLTFYLGLGWVGAISGYFLFRRFGWVYLKPLMYGAIAYTIGAVLDYSTYPVLIERVIGPHEIFHLMVIVGIAMHWKFLVRIVEFNDTKNTESIPQGAVAHSLPD
ncbi:MAG: hemolysin III family protein [Gammaproteobacteria bacterium]|jgi:channel protein (hemolysin III family)